MENYNTTIVNNSSLLSTQTLDNSIQQEPQLPVQQINISPILEENPIILP
jgi:hypothetical protein